MKACIFDLDGTLTDTLESLAYSVKATLREMGLPEITTEQCRRFVGDGAKVLMERPGWKKVLPYTGVYLMKIVHIM